MTDLEISKALALAIGWKHEQIGYGVHYVKDCVGIRVSLSGGCESRTFYDEVNGNGWCVVFDYLDWNVIGPIAAWYDCFPFRKHDGNWDVQTCGDLLREDTPQKAIALAVISRFGGRK